MAGKPGRAGSAGKTSPIPHTRLEDEKQFEDYYEVGEKLGEGAFGIVREVKLRRSEGTDVSWACKAINKEKAGSSKIKLLEREVSILKKVRHEHIIQLKEVFETPQKMYLVIELCAGGELSKMVKEREHFSETDARTILSRLASAISYLHKHDMVHRDLKLENILMSKNPDDSSDDLYIKVTDFGLSVVKDGVGHENMMMDFCGTPMFMAPEIIDNKTYSEKCDIWAMGVIMCVLLTGGPPFHCASDEAKLIELFKTLDLKKKLDEDPEWKNISKEAKDCVIGMLNVDPAHRVTASEVLDHAWIKGESLLENNPRNVLEMMREWRNDLANGSDNEDSAINGSSSGTGVKKSASKDAGVSSAPSSRGNSAGSTKHGKSSDTGSRRTSFGANAGLAAAKPKRTGLSRNHTEPSNLHLLATTTATSTKGGKGSTKAAGRTSTTGTKSKSPIDGPHGNAARSSNSTARPSKTSNHHTARTTATKTITKTRTSPDFQKTKDKKR